MTPGPHHTPHLSPSRLTCYERCPALYRQRYILKVPEWPTTEMAFGRSLHKALEAHFRGEDAELVFLRDWRQSAADCRQSGLFVAPAFTARGLQLFDMVKALGLSGEPERLITLLTPRVNIPIIGYVDLWGDGVLYDFKTSAFGWGPTRADQELFQPAIYSQAYAEELGKGDPRFEFIVLSRSTDGPLQRFDATRNTCQIMVVLERVREIHELIENQVFDCTCGKHVAEEVPAA